MHELKCILKIKIRSYFINVLFISNNIFMLKKLLVFLKITESLYVFFAILSLQTSLNKNSIFSDWNWQLYLLWVYFNCDIFFVFVKQNRFSCCKIINKLNCVLILKSDTKLIKPKFECKLFKRFLSFIFVNTGFRWFQDNFLHIFSLLEPTQVW